jgi:hypothetical protein
MTMREKLMINPLPIDSAAARVTRPAKAENLWRPMPRAVSTYPDADAVLRTAKLPNKHFRLHAAIGKRRDRMAVLGYAADQGSEKQGARFVVRCDCGAFEYRRSIFKWLGTKAPDMCRECRVRKYIVHGHWYSDAPAERERINLDLPGLAPAPTDSADPHR